MNLSRVLFVSASLLLGALNSHGVIVAGAGGTSSTTTTAPVDDFGFSRVCDLSGVSGTAVYLGNYSGEHWYITANHVVLTNDIICDGVTYSRDTGFSGQQIGSTDMQLFKGTSGPSVGQLPLMSTRPAAASELFFMGFGRGRGATETYWNDPGGASAWVELPSSVGANREGYKWTGATQGRWGNNLMTGSTSFSLGTTGGTTTSFQSNFTAIGETYECAGSLGDSGGGVFYKDAGTWKLAGIMLAVGNVDSEQPASTSVYGGTTYASDISVYRDDILNAIPEPRKSVLIFGALAALLVCSMRRRAA